MLERIRLNITNHPNRKTFFTLVGKIFPRSSAEYRLIEKAYRTAKDEFRALKREGGERYFEHLRSVALIVMIHMRVRDANIIAATLLHDIIEDIKDWDEDRLVIDFNSEVGSIVWWVTKPDVDLYDGDKEKRNRAYHQNLNSAPREALIVKLADRLHNLLTLWDVDDEKQKRKVRETQDFYLSLAEKEILLVHELEAALDAIMLSWKQPVAVIE